MDVVKKIVETLEIQQRNVVQIVDTQVMPVVEELEEVSKVFPQDRVQQSSADQTIEIPAVSLAQKIIEMLVTRTQDKTQHVMVVNAVNAVEAEKPIINEKINQVTKHVEIPQLQIVEKTAKTPETQITQGTQTSESMGNTTARQVVEIKAYLLAESASPMFVCRGVHGERM